MRGRHLPLRWKLTIWYLSLFGVIQASLLVAAMLFRQDAISQAFHDDLRRWSGATAQRIAALDRAWSQRDLERAIPMGAEFLFCAIRNRSGEEIVATGDFDAQRLSIAQLRDLLKRGDRYSFMTVKPEDAVPLANVDEELRIVAVRFEDGSKEPYFLQAGVRARPLRTLPSLAVDLFMIGIPVGLVACGVAAWLLAGKAVAPINRISESVRTMSPSNLEARVELHGDDAEIARLQEELNHALQRIEDAFQAQEQFISNISHELKTPVSVLLSEAQVLQAGGGRKHSRYREFATSVEEEMRRLGHLVESFLTLARARHEGLTRRERVPLNDIVLDCMQHSKPLAERSGVRVLAELADLESCASEPELLGDPDLLRSMLDNLLRNAIRFSPRRGVVEVRVVVRDGAARIEVADEGPGVPAEIQATLFDRFVQGPKERRRGGLGLGLAIARSVAESHGGTIGQSNRPQGGCEFWVELPLVATSRSDADNVSAINPDQRYSAAGTKTRC